MWEITSLGEIPYRDWVVDANFWKTLAKGQRLSKPRFATADMWTIMCSCWEYLAKDRPHFSDVSKSLKRLIKDKESHGARNNEGKSSATTNTNANRVINIHQLRTMSAQ